MVSEKQNIYTTFLHDLGFQVFPFRRMWSFVASIVLLLLILFATSGCSGDSEKRILVWTSLRPVERELLQEKLDIFAKRHPEYRFKQLFYETEELRTNFIISAIAGKGPALIHSPSDNIGPLSELEVIMPLESYFDQAFLDSFLTEPFPANTWFRGHLYQIADRVGNHLTLVYNKRLIADPPQTMSELIEVGKTLAKDTDGDGQPDQYALAWNFIEPFFVVPFIGGYGGWIFDENNNPTLNTPAVIKAAQLIYDLGHKYRIIPRECDYETANALFKDEKSAMIINGPWSWGTYLKAGIDIGLARIPKIDETGLWPTPMVSPMGYLVNVNLKGERLKITLELLRYLTSTAVELDFARRFSLIPSRKDAAADSVLQQDEIWRAAKYQMEVGRLMPVITEMRWVWDAMRPAYQAIFPGNLTPEEAARRMQALAEKLIRENR